MSIDARPKKLITRSREWPPNIPHPREAHAPVLVHIEWTTVRKANGHTGGREVTQVLNRWYIQLATLARSEKGQTMAEYGIILVLIAVAAVVAITALQGDISAALNKVGDKLNP